MQSKAKQNNTKESKAKQCKAKQFKAMQSNAIQSKAKQCNARMCNYCFIAVRHAASEGLPLVVATADRKGRNKCYSL